MANGQVVGQLKSTGGPINMANRQVVGQLKSTGGLINIEWEIPEFLSLSAEVDECYGSPVHFFCNSSWYLEVYPNGQKYDSSEGCIGVYLVRGDSGPPVSVTYSLFFKKVRSTEDIVTESKRTFDGKEDNWGEPEAIRRSELIQSESEFLPSGVLTVICSLKCDDTQVIKGDEVLRKAVKDCIISADVATETDAGNKKLLWDLEDLFVSGDDSDVTVRVRGEQFRLHRAILGARSLIFSSMFRHNMKEKATGIVSIDDCEAEIFRVFVHYLYTGNVDELSQENVVKVYRMADKYQVDELKASCLDIMKCTLSVDTFCGIVDLALQHDVQGAIEWCTDFLSKNMIEVIRTKSWRGLMRNNLEEVNELLIQAHIRKSKK